LRGITEEPTAMALAKEGKGVWEVAVGFLEPAIYDYTFGVDGAL